MIDATVQRLLERTIDSPIKLQLLLLFHDNAWMEWSDTRIAGRIYRDIWSTREALHELTQDGILSSTTTTGDEPLYCYRPCPEYIEAIARLCRSYDEPLEREHVQQLVREVAGFAPYRRASEQSGSELTASY